MSWNWRNINAQKSPEIASTVASGAAAGTMIAPGVGTVIGGIVGLGIGLGKAGEGGKTKMHHSYTRANDNVGRGKIRDPFGGGAYWDYEGVPEHIAPDTAIWDLASMAMNLAPSVVSAVGGMSGGQTKIDSGPIPAPQINTPKNGTTSFMGNTMSPLMDKYKSLGIISGGYTESIPDRPAIEMVPGRTTIREGNYKATTEQGYRIGPGTLQAIPGPGKPDMLITEPVIKDPGYPEYNVNEYQVPGTMFETMFPELNQQQTINMPKYEFGRPMRPPTPIYTPQQIAKPDASFFETDFGDPVNITMDKLSPRQKVLRERQFSSNDNLIAPQQSSYQIRMYEPKGAPSLVTYDNVPGYPHIRIESENNVKKYYINKAGERMPYSDRPQFEKDFIYGGVSGTEGYLGERTTRRKSDIPGEISYEPNVGGKIKEPLWSKWEKEKETYYGEYQYGAKGSGNKYNNEDTAKESIDCSGIICEINKKMGWDKINVGSANIRDKFDKELTKETVGHGDLIYIRAKKASENHIAQILIDPVTNEKFIAESAASKRKDGKTGIRIEPFDERIEELEKIGKIEYGRINKIYNKYNS